VLLFWLLGIVLVGIVLAGVVIYRQASVEANALFDYQLQQTAAALPSEPFSSVLGTHDSDGEGVVIQIWSRDGAQLYYSHPRSPLAPRAELGFTTEHTPTGDWRVYSAIVGDNVVQLGQPMSIRNLLAAETAWRTVWPLLILFPVLGVGVWIIVGRGLRPLSRLARALEARRPEAVDPLPDRKLSSEIRPLVHALNGLLQRLNVAFDTQKAFVADAAHELRTPLAALRIQAQLLERAKDGETRAEALSDLKKGVDRATRLVEQLLSLARAESTPETLEQAVAGVDGVTYGAAVVDSGTYADGGVGASALGIAHAGPVDTAAGERASASSAAALAPPIFSSAAAGASTSRSVEINSANIDSNRERREPEKSRERRQAGDVSAQIPIPGRVNQGNRMNRVNQINLVALVEACVAAHAPLAIDKGVDLGIEERTTAHVAGDAEALRVMIGNLLDNAVKYTPAGGRVDVSMGRNALGAFVDIIDTGPGIAPAERQRVFDRFYRSPDVVDAPGSNVAQGSGLGLAIVKRIADRHHAQIVLSSVGQGRQMANANGADGADSAGAHTADAPAHSVAISTEADAVNMPGLHVRVQFSE
jgi:signal transduction histidine kinase